MDHTKPTNRRLSFSVPLTVDDPEDPGEAYAKAMADGRVGKAVPDDSGVEDLDTEVFGRTLDKIEETALLVSRIKHENRRAKRLRQDVSSTVLCPICGKTILYHINGYNWHSRGACPTPGCLDWRE
jgi:hypothetical protein